MTLARRAKATLPSRTRALWLLVAAACLALWGYAATAAAPEPKRASNVEPEGESNASGRAARRGRAVCAADAVDPERLDRQLERLARAATDTRRCVALRQLASVPADNGVPAAHIARYTRRPQAAYVRACAVEALGMCRSPGALEALLELSERADDALRTAVASALAARDEDAALARLRALAAQEGSPWRVPACVALAEVGAPGALDAIAAALRDALAPDRRALVVALGESRDPAALALLGGVLAGASHGIEDEAIAALGAHGSAEATHMLIARLERQPSGAYAVLRALAASEAPSAYAFLLSAAEGRNEHVSAADAFDALSESRAAGVSAMMRSGLAHASAARRAHAVRYFIEHPDPDATPELLALVRDDSRFINGDVLAALGASGGDAVADLLEERALREGDRHASSALQALAAMPEQHERARDLALELVEREPRAALRVLEELDPGESPAARSALLELAQRTDKTGAHAIQVLSSRADADSERLFVKLAKGDGWMRGPALRALARSGSASGTAVVRELLRSGDDDARSSAVGALGSALGVNAQTELLAASHDRTPEVAAAAVEQLAMIASPAALTRLEQLVDADDPEIASSALAAVASAAPERVADAVERVIASNQADTLRGAMAAARQLDRALATQLVEHGLRSAESEVVVDAIDALANIATDRAALRARLDQLAADRSQPNDVRSHAREQLEYYTEQ